jgi:hypothetical protein
VRGVGGSGRYHHRDKDLLALNPFAGIAIITVNEALERLGLS